MTVLKPNKALPCCGWFFLKHQGSGLSLAFFRGCGKAHFPYLLINITLLEDKSAMQVEKHKNLLLFPFAFRWKELKWIQALQSQA